MRLCFGFPVEQRRAALLELCLCRGRFCDLFSRAGLEHLLPPERTCERSHHEQRDDDGPVAPDAGVLPNALLALC